MTFPTASTDRVLSIYIALAQYPILRVRIRARMRRELFDRGVISPQQFEAEVHEKAIQSQAREMLHGRTRRSLGIPPGAHPQPPDRLLFRL